MPISTINMLSRCVRRLAVASSPSRGTIHAMTRPASSGIMPSLRPWTTVSLVPSRAFSSEVTHPIVAMSRVWIGGLPFDTTHGEVRARFEKYGKIKKLELPTTPDGRSNGTCYITYETPEEATAALSEHEATFGTRWIRVKHLRDLNKNAPRPANVNASSKVFVGNLPYNFTEADVADLLASCGPIVSVNMVADSENNSKGFGFALFENEKAAAAAIKLSGTMLQGRPVSINYATRAPAKERGVAMADTVFVANLPRDVEEEVLESMFDHCGAIDSIRLAKDHVTGEFRGFAHITFAMPEGATKAMSLDGAQIDSNTIGVELAISKNQRKRRQGDGDQAASADPTQ